MEAPAALVDVTWLKDNIDQPGVKVVDGSWHLPMANRNPREEYTAQHIPGAVFFDLDECRDKGAKYGEQMLPSAAEFEDHVSALGISNDDHVVIYDNNAMLGLFSAPRVWFLFRVFSHAKVSVLNGGLPQWQQQGGTVTSDPTIPTKTTYKAKYRPELIKSYDDVRSNCECQEMTLVDARPAPRFNGTAPEPIPGIKPGHIKNSKNLPFLKLLGEDKVMKPRSEVEEVFRSANVDFSKPTILSCGSGMTASIVALAAHVCGHHDIPVYDGAWAEWFLRAEPAWMEDVPCEMGESSKM